MDGQRSVSGRACLPVLIVMIVGLATIIGGTLAAVQVAHGATGQVAGHRGATGITGYPEQSIKALQYAKAHGASIAEGDVLFTKDNHAVMMHDRTLDRTTNCTGPVAALTFAQLRKCAPASVVPQPLAWLKEVKRLGMSANLEMRGNPVPNATQMKGVVEAIRREAPKELVIASFDPKVLDLAKAALGSRARYAPIIQTRDSLFGYSVAEHAKKWDLIMIDYRALDVGKARQYQAAGVSLWLWTVVHPSKDDGWSLRRSKALLGKGGGVLIADDVKALRNAGFEVA